MDTTNIALPGDLPDESQQFLMHVPPDFIDPWLSYDSWTLKTACLLITIGFPVDLDAKVEEAKDWPDDASGRQRLFSMLAVYDRAASIARSSVAAGLINDPDTPERWLSWAERKGYRVDHLRPHIGRGMFKPRAENKDDETQACGGTSWQEQARAIADEIDARDQALGTHDSITSIAGRVAVEMRKRDIKGPRGPLSGNTIKREALQGGLWARPRGRKTPGETGGTGGTD